MLNDSQIVLGQDLGGSMGTVVSLEINADSVEFLTHLGTGKFDQVQIEEFEALSTSGRFRVQFTNLGVISAEFNLGVACSENVEPISSEVFFLKPFESKILTKSVRVRSEVGSVNNCTLTLSDAIGT